MSETISRSRSAFHFFIFLFLFSVTFLFYYFLVSSDPFHELYQVKNTFIHVYFIFQILYVNREK